jgi:peptidoglycan/LPS O-acetylase OafA/YrhL
MQKFRYVHALRGLAICLVILVHTYGAGQNGLPAFLRPILEQGARGVQLFFVASAFTLFYSFDQRKAREKSTVPFFVRRFFRIAPMYYLGIAYFLWQDGWGDRYWLGQQDSITAGNVLANVFFVHWLNPYWITSLVPGGWSITVEMTFYLCVPLLFGFIRSLDRAASALCVSLLLCFGLHVLLTRVPLISDRFIWEYYLFLYFPAQLPVFLMGIMGFFIVIRHDYRLRPGTLLLLGVTVPLVITYYQYAYVLWFAAFFTVLLIVLARHPYKVLVNRVTELIGEVSYSAYLVHFAVLHWMQKWGVLDLLPTNRQLLAVLNLGLKYTLVLGATLGISYIFHQVVELPAQRFGKRLLAAGSR